MSTVLIYRKNLLPVSETFIQAQAGALKRFQARFVGRQRAANSLAIPSPILLNNGNRITDPLRKFLFQFGVVPAQFLENVRACKASLLHAHFGADGASALPLAKKLNLPLVVTLHGYDVTMSDDSLRNSVGLRPYLAHRVDLWERASTFVCVSEFIRNKAIEKGFPASKLLVHYIGIDLKQFAPRAHAPLESVVVFVGRLVEKKGCAHLLRAMRIVQQSNRDARLIVIGDGPLRGSLEQLARETGIACEFTGAQPQHSVREWLQRATTLCVPSVTAADGDSEGLGMVFLEAQAMGVPVVSFRHGGIPEAVRHGETGLLAPEGDCETLAQYLNRYLSNVSLAMEDGSRGVEWVRQRFDLEKQTRDLETIYQNAAPGTEFQNASVEKTVRPPLPA